ncbi:MAG: hypothetical protein D6785_09245 [Planctomycetota bacterium]|nr:MAG: hypothetical protein D6785_09245 [Planctomycetota bacterium]
MYLGVTYKHLQDLVLPHLKKAIQIYPKFFEARIQLIKLYSILQKRQEALNEMLILISQMDKEDREKLKSVINYIIQIMPLRRKWRKKIPLPKSLFDKNPPSVFSPEEWAMLKAMAYFEAGHYEKAKQEYEALLERPEGKNWFSRLMYANLLLKTGDLNKAEEIALRLKQKFPHIPFPYELMYYICKRKHLFQKGLAYLEKALMIDDSLAMEWKNYGRDLKSKANYFYHQRKFEKFLEISLEGLRYHFRALRENKKDFLSQKWFLDYWRGSYLDQYFQNINFVVSDISSFLSPSFLDTLYRLQQSYPTSWAIQREIAFITYEVYKLLPPLGKKDPRWKSWLKHGKTILLQELESPRNELDKVWIQKILNKR